MSQCSHQNDPGDLRSDVNDKDISLKNRKEMCLFKDKKKLKKNKKTVRLIYLSY